MSMLQNLQDLKTASEEKQSQLQTEIQRWKRQATQLASEVAELQGLFEGTETALEVPSNNVAQAMLLPQAKKTLRAVAGQVGRNDEFQEGVRENATFTLKRPSIQGPVLVDRRNQIFRSWSPLAGPYPMIAHRGHLYTVQAGRALKLNTHTGNASTVFDFAGVGFFNEDKFGPFPASDATGVFKHYPQYYSVASAVVYQDHVQIHIFAAHPGKSTLLVIHESGSKAVYQPSGDIPNAGAAGPMALASHAHGSKSEPRITLFLSWVKGVTLDSGGGVLRWDHDQQSGNMFQMMPSSTIYTAVLPMDCKCVDDSCSIKCPVHFKKIKTVDRGVLSMVTFPKGRSPTHLYFATFSDCNPSARDYGGNGQECNGKKNQIYNQISFAELSEAADNSVSFTTDTVLAGGGPTHYDPDNDGTQPTFDALGTDARFLFYYARMGMGAGGSRPTDVLDRYGGVMLEIYVDSRTNRTYLVVAEGSGHKVRLIDVTSNKPSNTRVYTIGSIVGPSAIAMGGEGDLYIYSHQGIFPNLDISPAIPCANIWKLLGESLQSWRSKKGLQASALLKTQHTYFLRRAASSPDAEPFPWVFDIRKRTEQAQSNRTASKTIVCSKPNGSKSTSCCVRKLANTTGLSITEAHDLEHLLMSL